jgi:cell division protein FtsB
MKELQQKQKIKRRLYSTPGLIVVFLITLLAIKGTYGVIQKDRESSKYVSDLKTKMADLTTRDTLLKAEISKLGTTEGVNTLIKEKFSVAEQGEHVAVIVDQSNRATTTSTEQKNWFQSLWQSFIDLW